MDIVIVTLETPNFRFEAVGASEPEAMELHESAWSSLRRDAQPSDMLSFEGVLDGTEKQGTRYFLTTRKLSVGAAYRDGQLVSSTRLTPAAA